MLPPPKGGGRNLFYVIITCGEGFFCSGATDAEAGGGEGASVIMTCRLVTSIGGQIPS